MIERERGVPVGASVKFERGGPQRRRERVHMRIDVNPPVFSSPNGPDG